MIVRLALLFIIPFGAELTVFVTELSMTTGAAAETPFVSNAKEDIWITAEGVVPFGDDMTIADAKVRSRNEARRKAVERAVGIFIKGSTVVYNFMLAEDLVQTIVRGIVVEEHIISEGVREVGVTHGDRAMLYATLLKARVKPISAEHQEEFSVKGSLSKKSFSENDEMHILLFPSEDAYVHIFNVGGDNAVTVLFPNRITQDNFIRGKTESRFPSLDQMKKGIHLRVLPPPKTKRSLERIKIIATRKKIDLIQGKFGEPIFRIYSSKDTGLITDLLKLLAQLENADWAEVTLPYEVVQN